MFVLYNPILLRCVSARMLKNGAMSIKKKRIEMNSLPLLVRIDLTSQRNWVLTHEKNDFNKN